MSRFLVIFLAVSALLAGGCTKDPTERTGESSGGERSWIDQLFCDQMHALVKQLTDAKDGLAHATDAAALQAACAKNKDAFKAIEDLRARVDQRERHDVQGVDSAQLESATKYLRDFSMLGKLACSETAALGTRKTAAVSFVLEVDKFSGEPSLAIVKLACLKRTIANWTSAPSLPGIVVTDSKGRSDGQAANSGASQPVQSKNAGSAR